MKLLKEFLLYALDEMKLSVASRYVPGEGFGNRDDDEPVDRDSGTRLIGKVHREKDSDEDVDDLEKVK